MPVHLVAVRDGCGGCTIESRNLALELVEFGQRFRFHAGFRFGVYAELLWLREINPLVAHLA